MKFRKVCYYIIMVLLLINFLFSAFYVCTYILDSREQKAEYDDLAALVEQVPNLYDTMIKTMMLSEDKMKIREVLNTSLELLRKMEGNPFQVPANLILTEEDFK